MKVLHYCSQFSPVSETFIYDVILQLDKMEITNQVLTDEIVNRSERPYANVIRIPSLKRPVLTKVMVKILQTMGFQKKFWHTQLEKNRAIYLEKLISANRPDIIHAHFGPQGVRAFPAARKLKIPLVVSFHGFDAFKLPKIPVWKEKLESLFKDVELVTVVSEVMRKHLISLGCPSEKVKVIHVGKKLGDYAFKNRVGTRIRNFVSIGRVVEKKGHLDCIRAFGELLPKYPDLSLKIIGEGELIPVLNSQIKENGFSGNIQLLGRVSHEKTKSILEDADAFILCSKTAADGDQEGIPTVLMEAQALGVPCISTFHSGIPEVMPVENHWMLAEEGNYLSIAAKMEELMSASQSDVENATRLAREKTEAEFSLESEVSKLKDLYNSVFSSAGSAEH